MKTIKKSLLFLGVAISAFFTTNAQNIYDNPANRPYFGVRLGVDVTSASDNNGIYNNGAGFQAGVIYNLPIAMNFYFEPGLNIFYDTFGQSIDIHHDGQSAQIDGSIRNFGFRAPFNFGFHFDFTPDISVSVFTGPILNYSVKAKSHWEHIKGFPKYQSESLFGDGGFKHFDLQWNIGASLTYGQYFVSISGAPGLTKVMDTKFYSFRRNTFTIAIGYNF